jgi:predicted NodU family carbamoyl transferase
MNIPDTHIVHDSSVALVGDGKIIVVVAEECFTRIKHYSERPTRSVELLVGFEGEESREKVS